MPFADNSARKESKKPCKACLDAEKVERKGVPNLPTRLLITTIWPWAFSSMAGRIAFVNRMVN